MLQLLHSAYNHTQNHRQNQGSCSYTFKQAAKYYNKGHRIRYN